MKKIREIVRLHLSSGASVRQIATACDVGRTTVSEYVARIGAAVQFRPGDVGDVEFAVGGLPDEEVAPAHFAGGADH